MSNPERIIINWLELNLNRYDSSLSYKSQNDILHGKKYKLKVDYTIYKNNIPIIYIEYSGMNYFSKYYKIFDLGQRYPMFVIFDDNDLIYELTSIINNINNVGQLVEFSNERIFSRIKQFHDEIEYLSF